jgi:hypothetical protein
MRMAARKRQGEKGRTSFLKKRSKKLLRNGG